MAVSIAVKLYGDNIPLPLFADAMKRFSALVESLTNVLAEQELRWELLGLERGSVYAEAHVPVLEHQEEARKVADAYEEVARALVLGKPILYPEEVERPARALVGLINGSINSVEFRTDKETLVVKEPLDEGRRLQRRYVIGSMIGAIDSITRYKKTLRFKVMDPVFGKYVYCSLPNTEEHHETLRGLWGNRVEVAGSLFRDPDTGRPVEFRDVFHLSLLPFAHEDSFRRALGALQLEEDKESDDDKVRRLHDG